MKQVRGACFTGFLPLMYSVYSVALAILGLALLPYFAFQAFRYGKYVGSFRERLGRLPDTLASDDRETVWVHAVSVGEFQAARPLIEQLRREIPGSRVVVSTVTMTGQRLARAHCPNLVEGAFYFPFDWGFAVRRVLKHIRPSLVVILETELWPNFLRQCRLLGAVTVLVNGRISDRSFIRYRKIRWFIRRVLRDISLLIMQSEADAERARSLGALAISLRVCGNLKYEAGIRRWELVGGKESEAEPETSNVTEELDHQFALEAHPLIVAGSTAPGEEALLLEALRDVRSAAGLSDTRLLLAPRHPERFDEVAELISRTDFTFVRRSHSNTAAVTDDGSQANSRASDPASAEIILLDSIGELTSAYRFASVVVVGGSLVPRGGHNVIEPAAYGKPIIVGPHTDNFREIIGEFLRCEAIVQLPPASASTSSPSAASELIRLLSDRQTAEAMGGRARELVLSKRGAVECIVSAIRDILKPRLVQ